jgi:hypothetical protein
MEFDNKWYLLGWNHSSYVLILIGPKNLNDRSTMLYIGEKFHEENKKS